MKYGLEITQICCGEKMVTAVDAEGIMESGLLRLAYSFDGAEYDLRISQNAMVQYRSGDISTEMHFVEGKTIDCRINDGNRGGSFPVYTHALNVQFFGADCKAECRFSDGQGGETTSLIVWVRALN